LPDSTHTSGHRGVRIALGALVAVALVMLGMAGAAARALADGDPASDVLATQSLFVPADGGLSAAQQARLAAVVSAAQRTGYPIRVAMVATPADLGSVTALWRMPADYAAYLGTELSLVFHGTLLVVMPNGLGVARVGASSGPAASALAGLGAPGARPGPAAVTAIRRLAAAAGHPLAAPAGAAPSPVIASSSWLSSVDLGSWIALLAGGLLIASAWAFSLRARPLRAPWRTRSAG
jgi:hypothetical protein